VGKPAMIMAIKRPSESLTQSSNFLKSSLL